MTIDMHFTDKTVAWHYYCG